MAIEIATGRIVAKEASRGLMAVIDAPETVEENLALRQQLVALKP
jgi:hypothetical protein